MLSFLIAALALLIALLCGAAPCRRASIGPALGDAAWDMPGRHPSSSQRASRSVRVP
jgi:hypothetical protein